MLFLILTIVTVFAKPVPLALSSPHLVQVENQLYMFAQSHWTSATSAWSNVRRLEGQMKDYGRSHLLPSVDDLAASQSRLVSYGASGYRGLELRVFRAAAALLDIAWPVKRWPVYVFTAGAMLCLLTSTVCHLFGCCARHVSQVIWRFDYVGIALLIVCSFYPPVYYGQCLLLHSCMILLLLCPDAKALLAKAVIQVTGVLPNPCCILYHICNAFSCSNVLVVLHIFLQPRLQINVDLPVSPVCQRGREQFSHSGGCSCFLAFLPELWLV